MKLYKKEGRKYIEVSEYDDEFMDSFPYGTHMVELKPGSTLRRFNVEPDLLPLLAAAAFCKEEMTEAIYVASKARPEKKQLTAEQQRSWKQFEKTMGSQIMYIQYPSCADIAEVAILALKSKVDKMLQNESVREAYEHFMLLAKMSIQDDNPN